MRTRVAFDVSGLAWQYRTGVQNLYWAFAQAWQRQPQLADRFDLLFYDRSGTFNRRMAATVGAAYRSSAPAWWPARLRRPLQALIRGIDLRAPRLDGAINHVWNWALFNPAGSPASITIPDLLPLEYPQWFDARFQRLTRRSLDFAAREARFVFAISAYVRGRILDATGLAPDRVRVVYPGIDDAYFAPPQPDTAERTLRRYGLTAGRYLLSSGFLDPRKNLERQLQAFEIACQGDGADDLKYALTGLRNTASDSILRIIDSPGLRSRVVFLGYVAQDELIALMSRSAALMYCSIAEGFGLPIVEAMAVGAPVITSATTSMQELAQSRATLVDPLDVDGIAAAIGNTLGVDFSSRERAAAANRRFAERFTIDAWLQGHLDAYAQADGATAARMKP